MPILNEDNYRPDIPFPEFAHLNTIFPSMFRQTVRPAFVRERIATPDDDFLDIDWLQNGNPATRDIMPRTWKGAATHSTFKVQRVCYMKKAGM